MQLTRLALTFFLALGVSALPVESTDLAVVEESTIRPRAPKNHKHKHPHSIYLHVHNKCTWTKEFALYTVTSDFQMKKMSKSVNIDSGRQHTFTAPFKATGMRLTGHAERTDQWLPDLLFEFGYSEYAGQQGTAWDISMMPGSDPNIGLGVYPKTGQCVSKTCFPWYCPPSQGWTNPDQSSLGSPADTVCYHKTDYKVVFCP